MESLLLATRAFRIATALAPAATGTTQKIVLVKSFVQASALLDSLGKTFGCLSTYFCARVDGQIEFIFLFCHLLMGLIFWHLLNREARLKDVAV